MSAPYSNADIDALLVVLESQTGPKEWAVARAAAVIRQLRRDRELIDFLADQSQRIANVTLPRDIVEQNVHSLRDALGTAMARHQNERGGLRES